MLFHVDLHAVSAMSSLPTTNIRLERAMHRCSGSLKERIPKMKRINSDGTDGQLIFSLDILSAEDNKIELNTTPTKHIRETDHFH